MSDDRADAQVNGSGGPTNFGVVQERVRNLEQRVGELVAAIEKTNEAVHEMAIAIGQAGKTKWGLLIAGATLICLVTAGVWTVVWTLLVSPINDRVIDIKAMAAGSVAQERLDVQHLEDELRTKADSAGIEKTIDRLDLSIRQVNRNLGFPAESNEDQTPIARRRK